MVAKRSSTPAAQIFLLVLFALFAESATSQADDLNTAWLSRQNESGQSILVTVFYEKPSTASVTSPMEQALRAQALIRDTFAASAIDIVRTYRAIPAATAWISTDVVEELERGNDGSWRIDMGDSGALVISPERSGEGIPPTNSSVGSGSLMDSRALVNANELHALGIKGAGRRIAVLDTGIDLANVDFSGRVVAQACFCFNPNGNCCPNGQSTQFGIGSAQDDNGHGTHVAGIAAASGSNTGIAPDVDIVAVKTIDANNGFFSFADQTAALDWLFSQDLGLDAVNMSLGTFSGFFGVCDGQAFLRAAQQAIANLNSQGTVVVVSAGNSSFVNQLPAPACLSNTVTVGATDDSDIIPNFSNSSPLVNLFAPGVDILASRLGGGTTSITGTSMSAPHVTGGIAMLAGVFQSGNGLDVVDALTDTGLPLVDRNGNGAPRIGLLAAYANLFATDFIASAPVTTDIDVSNGEISVSFVPSVPVTGSDVPGEFEFIARCVDRSNVLQASGRSSPISIPGAQPGIEYVCTVVAVSAVGQSVASNSISNVIEEMTGLPIWLIYAADNSES